MKMLAPKVSIIILNWNGWRDTIECLESLYRIDYPNYDVIVVDNGSTDDSTQKIKQYAEGKIQVNSKFFEYTPGNKPIKVFEITEEEAKHGKFNRLLYEKFDPDRRMILIKSKRNQGFTGGNNIGIKFALSILASKYVLLLNNDIVVDRSFLKDLVNLARKDKTVGIVGSLVRFYNSQEVQSAGIKLNLKSGRIYHLKTYNEREQSLDCVMGCSMLISKDALLGSGLFDNVFFAYTEEIDLCLRVKSNGYLINLSPTSVVFHKHRGSTGYKINGFILFHRSRNYLLMIYKLFRSKWVLLTTPYLLNIIGEAILWSFTQKDISLLISTINGISSALKLIIKGYPNEMGDFYKS